MLLRWLDGELLGGLIAETEAYTEDDAASHCHRGMTPRNRSMFARGGTIYIYKSYGIHHCMNIASGRAGDGEGVLLRSFIPLYGIKTMRSLRGWPEPRPAKGLSDGPGKLTQALAINLSHNGRHLDDAPEICLLATGGKPTRILAGPRIGITKDIDRPWRFWLDASHISEFA